MNTYLSKLNPGERRFVVAVGLLFFLVLNIFFVWPHFSDWEMLQRKLALGQGTLARYGTLFQQTNTIAHDVDKLQHEGKDVPAEDQSVQFQHDILVQAAQSKVNITGTGRQNTSTNQFFIEVSQSVVTQSGEAELVDFLYNLGAGGSQARVRGLSLRPDPPRHELVANITLVASYQKNPKPAAAVKPAAAAAKPVAAPASAATKPAAPAKTPPSPQSATSPTGSKK